MPKWRPEKIRLISKELSVLGITMSILLFAITTSSVTAQNATTNASNAVGNASASVNQTSSEVGQNMSTAVPPLSVMLDKPQIKPCQNLVLTHQTQ